MTRARWLGVIGAGLMGAAIGSSAGWTQAIFGAAMLAGLALIVMAIGEFE